MVSWISFAAPLQGHLICFLLCSNYFMSLIISEQINSVYKLRLFLSTYWLQWTVSSLCSSLRHWQDTASLGGMKRKIFSLYLQNNAMLNLLKWERWWFLYVTSLFELFYLHNLCLSPTYFVHCQFKTLLICNFTAHAERMCCVWIRSHLEDVAVITNTFAFHSHQLQARSLVPLPHPSALRRPKIPRILYIYKIQGILQMRTMYPTGNW